MNETQKCDATIFLIVWLALEQTLSEGRGSKKSPPGLNTLARNALRRAESVLHFQLTGGGVAVEWLLHRLLHSASFLLFFLINLAEEE